MRKLAPGNRIAQAVEQVGQREFISRELKNEEIHPQY
jgi:hypothetical protein